MNDIEKMCMKGNERDRKVSNWLEHGNYGDIMSTHKDCNRDMRERVLKYSISSALEKPFECKQLDYHLFECDSCFSGTEFILDELKKGKSVEELYKTYLIV